MKNVETAPGKVGCSCYVGQTAQNVPPTEE